LCWRYDASFRRRTAKIDDSSPFTTLYNDYDLDDPLKLATVEESRLFVQEFFHSNLPARTIVDSEFTYLNERLAKHYGVPNVTGVADVVLHWPTTPSRPRGKGC
jgi:hypothetical protein